MMTLALGFVLRGMHLLSLRAWPPCNATKVKRTIILFTWGLGTEWPATDSRGSTEAATGIGVWPLVSTKQHRGWLEKQASSAKPPNRGAGRARPHDIT